MGKHLDPEVLAAYIDGRLSQAERNNANEHLARCPECVGQLAGAFKTLTDIKTLRIVEDDKDGSER